MELSVVKISSRRGKNPGLFFCCSGPLRISYGVGVETFRIIVPYSIDIDFIDDFRCKFSILDEIMECYGGDATKAHIAGTSNGGHAAFALMLMRPERFATLLGAPGEFSRHDPSAWAEALRCHAVFNGVGSNDDDWKAGVKATHDVLVEVGVNSVYVEFAGEGHIVSETFDESIFIEFWMRH